MIRKTHLALGVGVALYFLPHVNSKLIFFPAVIVSSLIPGLGSIFSKKKIFRGDNSGLKGKILNSYLTCVLISIFFALTYPVLALPFFLGYSFTLSMNTFSTDGIRPFWPIMKKPTKGHISPGGRLDSALFYVFVLFDIALLMKLII